MTRTRGAAKGATTAESVSPQQAPQGAEGEVPQAQATATTDTAAAASNTRDKRKRGAAATTNGSAPAPANGHTPAPPAKKRGRSVKTSQAGEPVVEALPKGPAAEGAAAKGGEDEEVELEFTEKELVLARDGNRLYDAKVVKVSQLQDRKTYFIHYQGWANKWDKWVSASDLLKMTEENKKLKVQLDQAAKAPKEEIIVVHHSKEGRKDAEVERKPRIDLDEDKEDDSTDPQVKLAMPFTLKKQLVDDWEKITKEPYHVIKLPCEPSASAIIDQFLENRKQKSGGSLQYKRFLELMEGVRIYFDRALPLILLYRQEREQYEQLVAKQPNSLVPSAVYGADHLLRLFVRLPSLLAKTPMSAQETSQVQTKLADFLKFLQKNHKEFFTATHERVGEVGSETEVDADKGTTTTTLPSSTTTTPTGEPQGEQTEVTDAAVAVTTTSADDGGAAVTTTTEKVDAVTTTVGAADVPPNMANATESDTATCEMDPPNLEGVVEGEEGKEGQGEAMEEGKGEAMEVSSG